MKKILAFATVCLMLLSLLAVFPAAEESGLPFAITAPTNVAVVWLEEGDSPTSMQFAYTIANEMAQFYKDLEEASLNGTSDEFLAPYGCYSIWTNVQIDWALDDVSDSVSGWHYNKYWDGTENESKSLGKDENYNNRYSEWDVVDLRLNNATETSQREWVLRGVPDDERWNGNPETHFPGVKDQLRPEQYTYDTELDTVRIDFTEHTAYFRARLVTILRKSTDDGDVDELYFSDWSATVGYGKDVKKIEPLKPGDVAAPVIKGLRKTDKEFNENPVVAFTLTVPDVLQTQLNDATALGGGITIETEARVKGDAEWTLMGNTDWIVKPGEMECALLTLVNSERPSIAEDTIIELRCRYRVTQPEKDDFFSAYSKIISFGTDDINQSGTTTSSNNNGEPEKKDECWLCHFCPQPLGLCIFIWLLIIICIIVIIIIIIVAASKKKKKDEEEKKDNK